VPQKKHKQGAGQGSQQSKRKSAEATEVARTASKQDNKAKGERSGGAKVAKVASAVETVDLKKSRGKQVKAQEEGVKVKSKKQRSN
jgi:predicted lipid-binding transport protein (Tim44 family)